MASDGGTARTDDDRLAVLEAVARRGPASAQEVADVVGCTRRAAEHRLRELYADGAIEPVSVEGGHGPLWRLAEGSG